MLSRSELRNQLESQLRLLSAGNYDVRPLIFEPPASQFEVAKLETDLKVALPSSMRAALTDISRHVEFRWFASEENSFPDPFDSNFSGALHWSLDLLRKFQIDKEGWIKDVFPNPDDPYDRVWHSKLAFQEVGNGDYLAIGLDQPAYGKIVYLSHDDGRGHGQIIADSFEDLLHRWVPLACTGAEDWQWLPFTSEDDPRIDPDSTNAARWRSLLGLEA
jgi:hypothetical protein